MQDGDDIFDGSHIAGPSRGRIEGSGIGGAGIGTILQVTAHLRCKLKLSVYLWHLN